MRYRIGIDLGGTKIECAMLGPDSEFVQRRRVATPHDDYDEICLAISTLVRETEEEFNCQASIGIGMPGIVSPATGLVKNANTVCLIGRPFAKDMQILLKREIRIENDANCILLSEVNGGAADGSPSAFGVIIGTGTGGALYANDALIGGANAIAGEWGHNPVPWPVHGGAARRCYCGSNNCVETFLSGAGLVQTYRELGGSVATTVEAVATRHRLGEGCAGDALARYAEQLAGCLANVVNIFDPADIVLGGGVSNLPNLCAEVLDKLPALAFSDRLVTRVNLAMFGDSSGVRGAAMLWQRGSVDV